jgi:phosphohistidine phosphatase
MMHIYMMQHGTPISKEQDPDRPLSDKGRADVEKMALLFMKSGMQVTDIFHSGKTRARQTAEIMASRIAQGAEPKEKPGLSPMDDPANFAEALGKLHNPLMIVGHLPHLSRLVSLLITGDPSHTIVNFKQGGVVDLEKDEEENWRLNWMVVPDIIPDASDFSA